MTERQCDNSNCVFLNYDWHSFIIPYYHKSFVSILFHMEIKKIDCTKKLLSHYLFPDVYYFFSVTFCNTKSMYYSTREVYVLASIHQIIHLLNWPIWDVLNYVTYSYLVNNKWYEILYTCLFSFIYGCKIFWTRSFLLFAISQLPGKVTCSFFPLTPK